MAYHVVNAVLHSSQVSNYMVYNEDQNTRHFIQIIRYSFCKKRRKHEVKLQRDKEILKYQDIKNALLTYYHVILF